MISYVLFPIGIYLLLKGADWLVDGASAFAKKFGVPTLVIGLTIVAFGTSMPELVVNITSAISGSSDIAFGNIIGSNVANILLILGVTASIVSLKVAHSTTWKEIPFSFLAVIALLIFSNTGLLDTVAGGSILRSNGLILLLFFAIFLIYVFELARRSKASFEDENIKIQKLSPGMIFLMIMGGLVLLYFGGKWTVNGAVSFARLFGLSEYLISLTVVAVGTSLPELLTSVVAAQKGNADIAIGNIVGSNIFNIFWILGITATVRPLPLPQFANIDLWILAAITGIFFAFMFIGRRYELDRWQGVLFLLMYAAYLGYIILR